MYDSSVTSGATSAAGRFVLLVDVGCGPGP